MFPAPFDDAGSFVKQQFNYASVFVIIPIKTAKGGQAGLFIQTIWRNKSKSELPSCTDELFPDMLEIRHFSIPSTTAPIFRLMR